MSYQDTIDRLIRMDEEQLIELFHDIHDEEGDTICIKRIFNVSYGFLKDIYNNAEKELSQDEDALEVDDARRARECKE